MLWKSFVQLLFVVGICPLSYALFSDWIICLDPLKSVNFTLADVLLSVRMYIMNICIRSGIYGCKRMAIHYVNVWF